MLGNFRIDEIVPMRLSAASVPDSFEAHEAAVANDVGGQDRGQAALHFSRITHG